MTYFVFPQENDPISDQYYIHTANPPAHPGAIHAPMPEYFALPDQRRIKHIPRPQYLSPPCETIPAITFSVNGYPGVQMQHVRNGTVTVDAASDPVLQYHVFESIMVSLAWPGYDPVGSCNPMYSWINVRPDGKYITRQNLAREICCLLFNFNRLAPGCRIASGWERWALNDGPRGICVSGIVLFSLHHYNNFWVPEFYVIE